MFSSSTPPPPPNACLNNMKLEIAPVYSRSSRRSHPDKLVTSIESGSCYHVNIKLIKAAERRLCDRPKRENKANSGEGALASGQGTHVTQVSLVFLARVHLRRNGPEFCLYEKSDCYCTRWGTVQRIKRSYWDREGFFLVVKGHASRVASLGQHAIKIVFTSGREEPRTPSKTTDWMKNEYSTS